MITKEMILDLLGSDNTQEKIIDLIVDLANDDYKQSDFIKDVVGYSK